jgi:hypothetical protein
MDERTQSIALYLLNQTDSTPFGKNSINHMAMDRFGNLWLSRFNGSGFFQFDKKNPGFKLFLEKIKVDGVYADPEGRIWLGTEAGLYRQNDSVYSFSPVGEKNSLLKTQGVSSLVWGITKKTCGRFPIWELSDIIIPAMNCALMEKNMGLGRAFWGRQDIYQKKVKYFFPNMTVTAVSFPKK